MAKVAVVVAVLWVAGYLMAWSFRRRHNGKFRSCYRIVRAGGVPSHLWEVTRVYVPWYGGVEHACIKSLAGRSETMTLATSVIADKKRFAPEN